MHGNGLRIEVLRFSLLIVLTVALASVAFRIHSHSSSSASHPRGGPSSSLPTPGGTSAAPQPSVSPTHVTRPPHGGAGGGGTGGGGTGSSGGAGAGTEQLPVTGWSDAVKLVGLASALIGSGALAVRAGGSRRPRQRAETVQD